MTSKREECIYMAKVCEQSERFADMLDYMKKVLTFDEKLNVEERNLLSVSYKNSVGTRRTAWRVLSSIETKEEASSSTLLPLLVNYKSKIEKELDKYCNEVIEKVDTKLLVEAKGDAECEVFYLKMKGDYYRYISEYATGDKHKEVAKKANDAYQAAYEIAKDKLATTHPIRLGLCLNYSVYYYEVEGDPQKACDLAKKAFDDAITDIEQIDEETYKDSTTIMQLIRDNLTLWNAELDPENQ